MPEPKRHRSADADLWKRHGQDACFGTRYGAPLLSMRHVFASMKKYPHPEEAAQGLSRRTHGGGPPDRQFLRTLERRSRHSERVLEPVRKQPVAAARSW